MFFLLTILVLAALVVVPWAILTLWNAIISGHLFPSVPILGYWHALGLLILIYLLAPGRFGGSWGSKE